MKIKKWKRRPSLARRRAVAGYMFILPFIIGFCSFVLIPLVKSLIFSVNDLEVSPAGFDLVSKGMSHYKSAFVEHNTFVRITVESVLQMVRTVPLVIIFSFFAANLLNQEFRGRTAARAIFFLPVILTTGIIIAIENSDLMLNMLKAGFEAETGQTTSNILGTIELRNLLRQTKLDPKFVEYILSAVDGVYDIVIASGVQILIFLAGLQSISPSLYEASNIEGATGWENFWKITFPMVSPLILVNMVYTIIDTMTKPNNQVMTLIHETAFRQNAYGLSAALSWIYFIVVILALGIPVAIISRFVFYHE